MLARRDRTARHVKLVSPATTTALTSSLLGRDSLNVGGVEQQDAESSTKGRWILKEMLIGIGTKSSATIAMTQLTWPRSPHHLPQMAQETLRPIARAESSEDETKSADR